VNFSNEVLHFFKQNNYKKNMRILIDMDDVIADAVERFLEWYERDFGTKYSVEYLRGIKLYDRSG